MCACVCVCIYTSSLMVLFAKVRQPFKVYNKSWAWGKCKIILFFLQATWKKKRFGDISKKIEIVIYIFFLRREQKVFFFLFSRIFILWNTHATCLCLLTKSKICFLSLFTSCFTGLCDVILTFSKKLSLFYSIYISY